MAPEPLARRVGIVGLGVMGGSLARALASLADAPERWGWSPDPAERSAGVASGALDRAPEALADAVRGADLVVVAAPLAATCALVGTVAPLLSRGAVLTDVASLKLPVAAAAREAGVGARWVGSHPMCGSEGSGFGASRSDLYVGARVHLVASREAVGARARVAALWTAVGAVPVDADAAGHDALMTAASHLPQLTANALARVLEEAGVVPADLGPGGRDMTRLAESGAEVWRDILAATPAVADHLERLATYASDAARRLREGDLDGIAADMERTRAWRRGA